jgi:hypothetical protein
MPSVYYNNGTKEVVLRIPVYKDVKSTMSMMLNDSYDGLVKVYRRRRGEWGEWFEHWQLVNGKPKVIKEGWM